jgi:predicted PurR-regulated permease PerM
MMVKTKKTLPNFTGSYISNNLFILILAVIVIISTWIFTRDLLTPILVGLIFAILTYPVYQFFNTQLQKIAPKLKEGLSGILTVIIVSTVLIYILNFFFSQLQKELPIFAKSLSNFVIALPNSPYVIDIFKLNQDQANELSVVVTDGLNNLQNRFSNNGNLLTSLFAEQNISRTLEVGQKTLVQVSSFIVSTLFFLYVWFHGLVNGQKWQQNLLNLFPFREVEKDSVRKDIKNAVKNVIYTELGAGLIHTFFVFGILSIFGVENRFIITFIVFLIGVLPLSPAEFAYAIPISLIFTKNPVAAILIIPIAEAIILWINFVYRPKMIAATNDANPILVLASIFSGIAIFGVLGFLIGPVLMIITQSLYNILSNRLQENRELN